MAVEQAVCGAAHLGLFLTQDWSKKAYQRADGTFGGIPHGQVKVVGSSMAERDSVIARVFQVCILIEGTLRPLLSATPNGS